MKRKKKIMNTLDKGKKRKRHIMIRLKPQKEVEVWGGEIGFS